jgi:hypothetical protein
VKKRKSLHGRSIRGGSQGRMETARPAVGGASVRVSILPNARRGVDVSYSRKGRSFLGKLL